MHDANSRSECLEARFHLELKRVSSEVNEAGQMAGSWWLYLFSWEK